MHSTPCFPTRRGNARFTPSRSLQRASRTLGALSSPIAPAARTSDASSLRGLPRQSAIASAGVGPRIVLRRSSGRTREPRLPTPSRVNGHWFRGSPRRLIRLSRRTVSFDPATRTARSPACLAPSRMRAKRRCSVTDPRAQSCAPILALRVEASSEQCCGPFPVPRGPLQLQLASRVRAAGFPTTRVARAVRSGPR